MKTAGAGAATPASVKYLWLTAKEKERTEDEGNRTYGPCRVTSAPSGDPFADRGLGLVEGLADDVDEGRAAVLDGLPQDTVEVRGVLDPP